MTPSRPRRVQSVPCVPTGGSSSRSDDAEPDPSSPGAGSGRPAAGDGRGVGRGAQDDAWAATGLLISGVAVWGGAGYLVSQWLHNQLFVMIGLLLGTTTALYGIWFRYGRS